MTSTDDLIKLLRHAAADPLDGGDRRIVQGRLLRDAAARLEECQNFAPARDLRDETRRATEQQARFRKRSA